MWQGLAILMAMSALLGMHTSTSSSATQAAHAQRILAVWLAGTTLAAALLTAAVEFFVPDPWRTLYRPLLAGLVGAASAVLLRAIIRRRHPTPDTPAATPWIAIIAAGSAWLLPSQGPGVQAYLGLAMLAGILCGILLLAGTAWPTTTMPRLLLGIAATLLALSALIPAG
jgi:hypothetical protein